MESLILLPHSDAPLDAPLGRHSGFKYKLDCAQRAQTSAKASNLNQNWSEIRIPISGLIRIRIRMSAGSLPKCRGFIILSASAISPSVMKISRCMRNANTFPKVSKVLYSAMVRKVEKWSRIRMRDRITTKRTFLPICRPIITPRFNEVKQLLLQ